METGTVCAVPLSCPVAFANCPPGPGLSLPPPPPRSHGGRIAAAAPLAGRTTCRSGACSGVVPDGPPPVRRQKRFSKQA